MTKRFLTMLSLLMMCAVLTAKSGVNYYGGRKETYYNLRMDRVVKNAKDKGHSGEYWVRADGVKMFGTWVIIASDYETYPYGSIVETSLGHGIVLDTGEFAKSNKQQIDIAVSW
jgi:3D (Asp-Asp-Asp) domain-containing protein